MKSCKYTFTILLLLSAIVVFADNGDKRKKRRATYHHTIGFDLGFNNYLENDQIPGSDLEPYTVKPWGSWYAAITSNHLQKILGPLHLQFIGDVSWYNFKFEDASTRVLNTNNRIEFTNADAAGLDPIKSKLSASYFNISLIPTLYFGRDRYNNGGFEVFQARQGFRIGLGGYAGYNLSDYVKFVFEEEGNRRKNRDNSNYFVNQWRYGAKFIMGVDNFDFFINYDLNPLFAENRGPELYAISFGIRVL